VLGLFPQGELGIVQSKVRLLHATFKINPSVICLNIGKLPARLLSARSSSRRGRALGSPFQQRLDVPMAFAIARQVQAGAGQAQARNLNSALQQRTHSEPCRYFWRSKKWFRAKRTCILNHKVAQFESWTR